MINGISWKNLTISFGFIIIIVCLPSGFVDVH